MNTKDDEYFRLQKSITHINRHENVVKRVGVFVSEMQKKDAITADDKEKWEELMQEQLESFYDMFIDQSEELKNYKAHNSHVATALRYYVNEYGNHLVSETFSQNAFMTTVTILPLKDNQTDVKVEIDIIKAKENDS